MGDRHEHLTEYDKKMWISSSLLPPPGDEVAKELLGMIDRLRWEVKQLTSERDEARASVAEMRFRLGHEEHGKPTGLVHKAWFEQMKKERDEARALAAEMWENATAWTGPTASSHYRSEISERLKAQRKIDSESD